jgi:cobalamin biosynthesis protein CobT
MSNNADGDNILVAWHRLMQQKQKRKVLIVLSDGSPATWAGDAYGFTKDVVKGLEARGDVDIIGIGIEDDNVERIYKTNKVIWNVSELPKALIYTLEHVILD